MRFLKACGLCIGLFVVYAVVLAWLMSQHNYSSDICYFDMSDINQYGGSE